MVIAKEWGRIQRHRRVRKKVIGSPERPRVVVHRSLKNIFVQAIDDISQKTLASLSSIDKVVAKGASKKGKISLSEQLGKAFAEQLKKKGVVKISFDRGGARVRGVPITTCVSRCALGRALHRTRQTLEVTVRC